MPDLSQGSCVTGSAGLDPDTWASGDPGLRQAARAACQACPVLTPCRTWALLLPYAEPGVLGGMTPAERANAHAAARRARHNGTMDAPASPHERD
jgi:Transcription factor WhiB